MMGDHQEGDQCTLNKFMCTGSSRGMYRPEDEHDSCGIGFVADIKGCKSHGILKRGLEVLERMEHRGAESADNKTGDGSGVLLQIPHDFYKRLIPGLPAAGSYGTGLIFFPGPNDAMAGDHAHSILKAIEETAGVMDFTIAARRDVPVNNGAIGRIARAAEPAVKQLVLADGTAGAAAAGQGDVSDLELRLFIFRKKLEKILRTEGIEAYMPSLSSRVIVYKGMMMSTQLKEYFPELRDETMATAVALVHSRFSTNTFPNWPLAQPFRMVAHNGEINTIRGNRFWMEAREALFDHPRFGEHLKDILPSIEPGRSDSASFDNTLELLVMSGRSLPHALMMLIPESWNDKNPIPDELKNFYQYHACVMEPWDGPASMVFCDGRYVGGTLDRNGLRPSRYTITRNGMIVMASETGVQDFAVGEVMYKGRLLPGKLLLVDMEKGRIIPDEEVKRAVCGRKPYGEWIKRNLTVLEQDRYEPETDDPLFRDDRQVLFMERSQGYSREDRENLLIPMAAGGQEPTASMGMDAPLAVFSNRPQRVYAYFKQVFAQVTNPPIDSIREDLVMTLTSFAGPQGNLLDEQETHCRRIKVLNPIMTPGDLKRLLAINPGVFKSAVLDAVFEAEKTDGQKSGLEEALDRLTDEAAEEVRAGSSLLVLSDRKALSPGAGCCGIPALLAAGAVHHGLMERGLRMKASIIVESAEPREIMHFALLFGYGADLIVPYGVLAVLAEICRSFDGGRTGDFVHAEKNYLKGLAKAMLKVMSKMGTSTLRSYRGAQIFEAVGLGEKVIDLCF
ncbi:MAG: glutamate synthase subunit alpha, partial [Treponema sp.]|nr:glutamate synthase subunit alpha [Treponema sp.]